jgi:hypothetical protein
MTRFLMIAIALAVLGAGVYALLHPKEAAISAAPAAAAKPSAQSAVAIEGKNDDELTKKTLEGIGSVTKLKPVELERPRAREGAANKQ